ncbi:MAG: hypothetical protein ACRDBM_00470 [Sporomusa sp.]
MKYKLQKKLVYNKRNVSSQTYMIGVMRHCVVIMGLKLDIE